MQVICKTLSDIDRAVSEMRYWIEKGDYNYQFSNRGRVLEQTRGLMAPAYVHLWMIMHPLEGQEITIQNNLTDLASWLVKIVNQIHKQRVQLLSVYIEFAGAYGNRLKSNLMEHHGYSALSKVDTSDASEAMNNILAALNYKLMRESRKDKHYQITNEEVQDIIKDVLQLKL